MDKYHRNSLPKIKEASIIYEAQRDSLKKAGDYTELRKMKQEHTKYVNEVFRQYRQNEVNK
jgi:hypothetical protein